jgi:transposase-like protein
MRTYVRVHGKWCYLYRAIDRDGNLVDSCLSEKRDMEAAQRFFKQAVETVGHAPERVTTDGHDATHVRFARRSVVMSFIAVIRTSTTNWSKTTVASSSAPTPRAGLATSPRQHVFVALLMSSVNSSASALP